MAEILIAVSDIIDYTKIKEMASKYGIRSVLPQNYKNGELSAIILDLGDKSMIDVVKKLNSNAHVIGFYSHVKIELKAMAENLGWESVPRSALENKLIELFAKSKSI